MNKEQVKQKIQKERGEYKRERRKKFLRLKNTGKYEGYLMQRMNERIKHMERVDSVVKHLGLIQRIYAFFRILLKRIQGRLFKG